MLGINVKSLGYSFNDLLDIQQYVTAFECSKKFMIDNYAYIDLLDIDCCCIDNIIIGKYNLRTAYGRYKFVDEFKESCRIASDLNCSKLLFDLPEYRRYVNKDIENFFIDLIDIAKDYNITLLFEALYNSSWICNHSELVKFSRKNGIPSIHVDFGTMRKNNEVFNKIKYNISSIHYPLGLPIVYNNVILENYNNINIDNVKKYLGTVSKLNAIL